MLPPFQQFVNACAEVYAVRRGAPPPRRPRFRGRLARQV